jgi:L-alanine-DL-glutamate epimerase-like enolase superfamily enzyme
MHLAASIPNFLIMEEGNKETAQYKDVFVGGWNQKLDYWEVPETPGLGVDFTPEFLREHQVKFD